MHCRTLGPRAKNEAVRYSQYRGKVSSKTAQSPGQQMPEHEMHRTEMLKLQDGRGRKWFSVFSRTVSVARRRRVSSRFANGAVVADVTVTQHHAIHAVGAYVAVAIGISARRVGARFDDEGLAVRAPMLVPGRAAEFANISGPDIGMATVDLDHHAALEGRGEGRNRRAEQGDSGGRQDQRQDERIFSQGSSPIRIATTTGQRRRCSNVAKKSIAALTNGFAALRKASRERDVCGDKEGGWA